MQGRKIGEHLLDFALEQAIANQAELIWLSVWQANPPALRFYERFGYEIFDTKIFWLGDEAQTDWLVKKIVTSNKKQVASFKWQVTCNLLLVTCNYYG